MRAVALVGLALAALAGGAMADEPPSGVITRPDWAARPTAGDIASYMPAATVRGISGKATIECRVTAKGLLEACTILSETPEGEGFGAAALKMAGKFRMKPTTLDGAPVAGGTVRIPIVMSAMGDDLPPPDLPSTTGHFVYAGPAPEARAGNGQAARAVYYLSMPDAAAGRTVAVARMVMVLDHPLTGGGQAQSYVMMSQTFDCAMARVGPPEMQFFDEAGQRTSWVFAASEWRPLKSEFKLDRARALACGKAQADGPVLASVEDVRADARTRFAAAAAP